MRIEDYLARHANDHGDKPAVIAGGQTIPYSQLNQLARQRAAQLAHTERQPLVVQTTQSADFLVLYFAAHIAQRPIVPLESNTPAARQQDIEARVSHANITPDVADILFTTGTTGEPKGTMITHEAIIANAENLVEAQHFSPTLTFVISGPLNHIGSLSKVWPMIVVGGTIIVTEGIKDIEHFFQAFDHPSPKMATFLVPASLRLLMQFSQDRLTHYANKIDFIETGAAPMSQTDMERLRTIFPHTRLYNTYASTETGIVATHDYQNDDCIAGCLGHPMKHSQIHILPDGIITCKGPTLMKGYVSDPQLSATILRDATLYTSDLGHWDEKGRLHLDGRADDMINVGGFKVSPVEVENITMKFHGIADCICIAGTHVILGSVLKLIYTVEPATTIHRADLIAHLKNHLELYKLPLQYEQAKTIRRTFNGKLDRKYYTIKN